MAGQQLQVLKALDVAKTQWYHFTAVVVAGMGFCTDASDLFCIPLLTKLLGRIYYHKEGSYTPGYLPDNVAAAVIGVALCGTIAGQLKRVYGMTIMLVAVSSIASGLSFGKDPKAVMSTLCFFRFWLGFGIGVDHLLSVTIMSEYANKKTRGAFIAAVFTMQGFGILAGGMVAFLASAAFHAKFSAPINAIDRIRLTVPEAYYLWRIIVMFGAIPPALTYTVVMINRPFFGVKLAMTVRYTALVAKNAPQAASDMAKITQEDFGLFSSQFRHRHGRHLLGTSSTWFLLGIAFYTHNLFQEDIFSAIGWLPKAENSNAIEEVYRTARAQIVIALCNTVPDYWFTVALIDKIDKMGRFAIQLLGFFFMTVFMFALRFFSVRLRSSCHGISAATGKVGAMVGALGFSAAMHAIGLRKVFIVLGVVNFLGMMFTFLVPKSRGKSLEEMSGKADVETADAENGTST
ncbi:hypothetical protein ACOSQ3_006501 [Xanthoceras sorbifolium]